MTVSAFDHVAIPITNVDAVLEFYEALGFRIDHAFAPMAYSAHLGEQKINFHSPELWQSDFSLRGPAALPGCGDFCFVWAGSADALDQLLATIGATVIEGPIQRDGGRDNGAAQGISTYVRDPDENLVEFIRY